MKVVLIASPMFEYVDRRLIEIGYDAEHESTPYGIYLLSSILKSSGHEVVLVDLIAKGTRNIECNLSDIEDCSLVGIGATSLSWATAVDMIKQIRQIREDVPIVLGGVHPTLFDQYILKTFPAQYVIRGEGEIAFPALCSALENGNDLKSVPNLSWRTPDGQIIRNPSAPVIAGEDLGKYPLPDYDILPSNIYRSLSIESSRGCAFNCSFCGANYRRSWRAIPAEQFVDRLEKVMQYTNRTTERRITIIDDEFSTDPKRATEIARIINQRGLKPKLSFNSRARDILSEDFIENIEEL